MQRHVCISELMTPTTEADHFNNSRFEVLLPDGGTLDAVVSIRPLAPFSDDAMRFVADLSSQLLRSRAMHEFPELMALGYWMRPASLNQLAKRYAGDGDGRAVLLAARGTAFHIAPSNVDTIFVYSWLVSLLAGNSNVVRLSRKATPQVDALLEVLTTVINNPTHASVRARTLLVRFDPSPELTALFSDRCDIRAVWGGDAAVLEVRSVPLPPLSTELVFGDRFSIALLKSRGWLTSDGTTRGRVIHGFLNDSYSFMQMACSSPRLVVWIGSRDEVDEARESFWSSVREELPQRHIAFSSRDYLNKRMASASLAIKESIRIEPEPSGDLTRLWIGDPSIDHRELHCGAGLFWEAGCESLSELTPALDRRIQTVAHFGFSKSELAQYVRTAQPRGVDRWVPIGHALDFDHIWDGWDLVRAFGRQVRISA